jgi:hypothetical protein
MKCQCRTCLEHQQGVDVSSMSEAVDHPQHYKRGGIEVIDVIEAFELGFCLGNTVKYLLRAGRKGDRLEDLRKAAWYLQREIERAQS